MHNSSYYSNNNKKPTMATDIESLPVISTKRLEGSLIAQRKFGQNVPNHLTETRIFSHVQVNGIVKPRPSVIHFDGYKVGKLHQQTLHIVNSSSDNLRMHVIPPTTDTFTITYKKENSRLVSGLSLDINVQFRPTEWRYYYDCIRIHCKGNENLLIPIHAYPVMNTTSFPRSITFPPTPIGQTKLHTFSLECDIPIDFEFQLSYEQKNPAFSVSPMQGTVPANGKVTIKVMFTPVEFSTAIMKLKLDISQFNSKSRICTFTGTSNPGLAIDQYKKQQTTYKHKPVKISTSERLREKKRKPIKGKNINPTPCSGEIVYEGIRFPSNLDTPTAVAKVLSQEAGKMKASQLKQATSGIGESVICGGGIGGGDSRQLKEAMFLQKVKESADEEKANKLRWVTHVGDGPITDEEREIILKTRQESQEIYKIKSHVANIHEECNRKTTVYSGRKTRRKAGKIPESIPTFDIQSNNLWDKRHRALKRFIQAARKVIIQNRCQQRLEKIKKILQEIKSGKEIELIKEQQFKLPLDSVSLSLLRPTLLPCYMDKTLKDTVLPKQPVQIQSTAVTTSQHIPILDLRVPQQYKLLGYSQYLLPTEDDYVVPDIKDRSLRCGAEDEYQGLTMVPGVSSMFLWNNNWTKTQQKREEETIVLEDIEEEEVLPLVPPPSMFSSHIENPLHIFNPSPSVVGSLRPLLPNSEVTFEHNLLPLVTSTVFPHPQPKIDPEDGISGVMKWKHFHSPFLSTSDERKYLVSRWRPRLSDPFSTELLPVMTHPPQLQGPQKDDIVDESITNLPVPTNEMIQNEFYIPDTSDEPVCSRKERETELYMEQQRQINNLGKQHQQQLEQLLYLLTQNEHY